MTWRELVQEAKKAGVTDSYAFAEYMVQVREHYGPPEALSETDAESTYDECMGIWDNPFWHKEEVK